MLQSKLLELLRRLDRRQMARIGEAVQSPFFNKSEDIKCLFQYLSHFSPSFHQPELNKSFVLSRLKTGKSLDERRLQYLMSDLVAIIENVLVLDRMENDEPARLLILAQTLADAGLPDRARQALSKLSDFWEKQAAQSSERLAQEFAAAKIAFTMAGRTTRVFDPTLQVASDRLTAFFLKEKLRLLSAMTNLEQMFKMEYRHDWSKEEIETLAAGSDNPLVQLWLLAYRLTRYDRSEDFQSLKQILKTQADEVVIADLAQLTVPALNFCTRRINRDADIRYYAEYLDLYKLLIQHDLILENGQISPGLYQNLVTIGLKTDDLPWTRQFIEDFRSHLPEDYAESMHAYNLGHLFYHEKKYGEAQQALARVDFRDPLLSVSARSLLIKIYVETGQDDLLFAALEAARVWLLRNQAVTAGLRRQFHKFVELTGKMARLHPKDADGAGKLGSKLPSPTEVLHREWLASRLALIIHPKG